MSKEQDHKEPWSSTMVFGGEKEPIRRRWDCSHRHDGKGEKWSKRRYRSFRLSPLGL